ncbi:DUF3570 domain-containing protein [Flavihumibacter petaseus]|uniref:DUF3570 domain-containing protein n=1 Tax=Flavihumibacter petaseus NBRC 106054 TaxID=1220578 RepID=A0A0E9N755_9BACT|nr:DUF3570 domain-containing protein [Flavihumibacter petaseus]GAO45180.1 hypothetical protein FPE01S_04_04240 [Flavihumibacter petaseus NBRC 106054]
MKKVFLSACTLLSLMKLQAQQKDSAFVPRKLHIDEINLVSSYYHQDGNNSAVTGGIGTEKLTDIANVLDIKLFRYDRKGRKNNFGLEMGIDHYTSASSDKIDLKANSSASSADTRFYPSVNWSRENETKGSTFGGGLSFSNEFDYQSIGVNVLYAQKTRNRNGEFTARLQAYLDKVKMIAPYELRSPSNEDVEDEGWKNRNSYSGSFSWTQVINRNLQVAVLADVVQQNGYLGLPFHRVYFTDGSVHQENLPDSRFKIPVGLRANYFLGDRFIFRAYYRYYSDNWGLSAHTADLEVPVKISPFLSISPFYRFYSQHAVKYFAPYGGHTGKDEYYTSNYDLSTFNSNFLGAGIRWAPVNGVFGWQHFHMIELRYGHYDRTNGLNSNIVSLHLQYK